jgi:hypothetical protein
VQLTLQNLSKLADAFAPKSKITNQSGDLGDLVDREMTNAAAAIDAAAERLNKLLNKPRDAYTTYELKVHDAILNAAIAITNAIAQLIKAATDSQQEIVREGKGTSSRAAFYKKHNRWTEGLISAAKAVATSTNMLIETADGVISGRNSPEQLIVASNDVAASTAQLVAASRVKASLMSKTQERLETASKAVTQACRSLVRQVQDIIAQKNRDDNDQVDYATLTNHELKTREMEQQVRSKFQIIKQDTILTRTLGCNFDTRERTKSCENATGRDEKTGLSGRVGKLISLLSFVYTTRFERSWFTQLLFYVRYLLAICSHSRKILTVFSKWPLYITVFKRIELVNWGICYFESKLYITIRVHLFPLASPLDLAHLFACADKHPFLLP